MANHQAYDCSKIGYWLLRVCLLSALALTLSGCLLRSGEQTTSDEQSEGGNVSTSFVSADGEEVRTLATGRSAKLNIIATVSVDQGDLRLDILNPDGAVVFAVASQPQRETIRQGNVTTNDQGQVRYRVVARDARNGNFQILYQRQ